MKKSKDICRKEKKGNVDTLRKSGSESEGGNKNDLGGISSRDKYNKLKTRRKQKKHRKSESENESRSGKKSCNRKSGSEPTKRKRRHDSSSDEDQHEKPTNRGSRMNRKRDRHDSE